MKHILLTIVGLFMAATSAHAQFTAGIRDSHYIYGTYAPVSNLTVKLEHSLYSEKAGFQRIGVGADYGFALPRGFGWSAGVSAATTWNGNYQVVEGHASVTYAYRRLGLDATLQPHYDSGLGYKTCWQAGGSLRIIDAIALVAHYTTIPEYRMSQQRLRGGFRFDVSRLTVTPEVSLSLDKATRFKNMRVLMSMQYRF